VQAVAVANPDGALALSPGGDAVLAGGGRSSSLIDLASGERRRIERALVDAAFSPDGHGLLGVDDEGRAELFSLPAGPPRVLAASGILRGFFVGGGRAVLVQRRGPALVTPLDRPDPQPLAAALSKAFAATFTLDRMASFATGRGELISGGRTFPLSGMEGQTLTARFDRDGGELIAAGGDQVARLFSGTDGRLLLELRGHRQPILAATFLSDGRPATASEDGTARVWEAGGREAVILRGHEGGVRSVVAAESAPVLATRDEAGVVRVFQMLDWARLIAWFARASAACLSPEQRRTRLGEPAPLAQKAWEKCERRLGRLAPP
jgi:WD40 repeat protein